MLRSKKTMIKRTEKLELLVEAAMPSKVKNHQCRETCGESDTRKSKHACIVEAHESTRKRLERTQEKYHEDRIAGKWFNSESHYNLVHKFIPWKIQDANAAVVKEWKKLDNASMANGQSEEQKSGHQRGTERRERQFILLR